MLLPTNHLSNFSKIDCFYQVVGSESWYNLVGLDSEGPPS